MTRRARWLWPLAAIIAVVAVVTGWLLLEPGPMAFAKGAHVALSAYSGANPTGVPAEVAQADLVTRGKYLALAGDCAACHTVAGGRPFAGGNAFSLPSFGTIYASNITPDKETGIGAWSDADFLRALHAGVDREGEQLYPAFPYDAFTYLTDDDVLAIKAYLFSLPPVRNVVPADALRFPFNQRWLIGVWSFLYNPDRRFEPIANQSPEWNRGAYLVEALAHCGDCHTPRNLAQGLDNSRKFSGALIEGWRAFNITSDRASGIGDWSDEDLERYLATGHAQGHGTTAGPMAEAVEQSLTHLAPSDIRAMVTYLRTVPAVATPDVPAPKMEPAPASPNDGAVAANHLGRQVFEGACVSCHDWTGVGTLSPYATLTGAQAVNDPQAINVAQIVLHGTDRKSLGSTVFMPGFGDVFSDREVAAVVNYVTARFGAVPSQVDRKAIADLRRPNAN